MRFFFITKSPELAAFAIARGADRLFVDLELNGKDARQGHRSTVISRHTFDDLRAVRRAAPDAELMARLNPLHDGSAGEIDRAVSEGADVIMLPMYRSADEARRFGDLLAGRARLCLLLETRGAMEGLRDTVALDCVDEIHIGLNDLHLDLGMRFMFEPIAEGLVDEMTAILRDWGKPFGFGGVARVGEGHVPAELILGEHVRLGSTAAILSRTFHREAETVAALEREMNFEAEIGRLRQSHAEWSRAPAAALDELHADVCARIGEVASRLRDAG